MMYQFTQNSTHFVLCASLFAVLNTNIQYRDCLLTMPAWCGNQSIDVGLYYNSLTFTFECAHRWSVEPLY